MAEEALAIAVYCALTHPEDLAAAVRLAANHSGDSDSTAAITGNIMGALLGAEAIPASWLDVLELRDTIDRLATAMHDRFVLKRSDVGWKLWNDATSPTEAPAPPHDAYWVTPGRLLAGPYPGAKYGVEAEGKLNDFLDLGVTCFIDLTEEGEIHRALEPYAALLRKLARRRGVEVTHLRMPIRDVDVAPRGACARSRTRSPARWTPARSSTSTAGAASGAPAPSSAATSSSTATTPGTRRCPPSSSCGAHTERAHRTSPETSAQRAMVKHWNAA